MLHWNQIEWTNVVSQTEAKCTRQINSHRLVRVLLDHGQFEPERIAASA